MPDDTGYMDYRSNGGLQEDPPKREPQINDFADFSRWVNHRWEGDPREWREKLYIACLGLVGEAGEVTEPIKKALYSGKPVSRADLIEELGDLLHYWTRIAGFFGVGLDEIVAANVRKLHVRLPAGHAPINPTRDIILQP